MQKRIAEADEFYERAHCQIPAGRQSADRPAGLCRAVLVEAVLSLHRRDWLEGDPDQPRPPDSRWNGRNRDWLHLFNRDVISMPDKWEYPWYAAWDLAFHMITFATIDAEFAKEQLMLMLREWYMHPNGAAAGLRI